MLNEKIFNYAMALLLCAAASCSGGSGEQSEALDMLAQAKECISKNPQQAISLIDSLIKVFPKQTEVRRKAMHVRTLADSVLIDREFAEVGALFVVERSHLAAAAVGCVAIVSSSVVRNVGC